MENWSMVGPKFSVGNQFSMKNLVPRTNVFADQNFHDSPHDILHGIDVW